jgi:sulfite exporter TauE/SafE
MFQAFVFGMIWGWLPCGLVYAAVGLATTAGDEYRGALTMLAFGIGTLPAVVGVGLMTSLMVRLSGMKKFRQAAGISLMIVALLTAFTWLNPSVVHILHDAHDMSGM